MGLLSSDTGVIPHSRIRHLLFDPADETHAWYPFDETLGWHPFSEVLGWYWLDEVLAR